MKTITLDWETYEEEMRNKYHRGVEMGIWKASQYIKDPINAIDERYSWEKHMLDIALSMKYPA